MFYDATKPVYYTRNLDLAAYLVYNLNEQPEIKLVNTNYGDKIQYEFKNQQTIRDLLEDYDRGEALVEPKRYSEIKIKIIKNRNELFPKPDRMASPAN
jgi:hypothetical protein